MTTSHVSKAAKGQQRRRRREKSEKDAPVPKAAMKKTKKTKPRKKLNPPGTKLVPIQINSDADDDELQLLNTRPVIDIPKSVQTSTTDHELEEFQEEEIEARNQANDLVQYFNLAIDDETSDDESGDDDPLEELWPIFSGCLSSSENSVKKRVLKSGKNGYQKPLSNPDSSSQKLLPAPIPKQTKHDRKKRQIKAIGANNQMFKNYFIRLEPVKNATVNPAIDPDLESASLQDSFLNQNQPVTSKSLDSHQKETNDESLNARFTSILENRLSAIKAPKSASISEKACAEWEELNSALNTATLCYKQKEKKKKKIKFPQAMMNNLYLFNNLCLEYTLNGTKSPSSTASLKAAQSAIKQLPMGTVPPKNRSGIYLSRLISRQATHVINNKHLSKVKQGNCKTHASLLDNAELRKTLFTWAASQVPGHVTPITFQQYVINTIFPKFNIEKSISRKSATRWMIKLGYRPQEHQKTLYFDGHKRSDFIEARKKYIEDFENYRKRSRIYGGDNLDTASQVDPEVLGKMKETVFIFHDESTIHAKERPKLSWLLPGTQEIRSKNIGRLIHISDFILETTVRL
ncbi:uncharacterized protein PGTG_15410 [Puccinia graminis f. sp. tritici CRL 75-36-700-3]|uniref:Uncharacterized protein n=1 Tax=Puccinia graminis f. sp. tritici (strain CRL 75-36-700-3 / race SCCL) TaxID=418459 RepID=E3KZM9_PUCGT|nr:uncharacterized protein PGTG_15410 [Puccinia graminis f. sp. tritici CRL 75-36-700-3]EFP89754.1 hypothetical protein PGTG_15410 [Puccinia graminis f. sp. tritici CRL 75-36-700-3]